MVEVVFPIGYTLEECVYALNSAAERQKEVAHGYFNDVELFSSDTIKETYEKVYGNSNQGDSKHISVDLGDAEGDYSAVLISGRDNYSPTVSPIIIDCNHNYDEMVAKVQTALLAEALYYEKKVEGAGKSKEGNGYYERKAREYKDLVIALDDLKIKPLIDTKVK